MKIHLPKIDKLLQFGILVMVIKVSFGMSTVFYYTETIDNVLTVLSVLAFMILILKQNYSFAILIGYLTIGLVGLYSVIQTGNYGYLITIITCLAIRKTNISKIIKHIFTYEVIFFFFNVLWSLVSYVFFQSSLSILIEGVTRYSFGFSHPNTFSIYLFNLILMWVWLNYYRIDIKKIVVIFSISFVAFFFTKSRTGFIDILILCFLLLCRNITVINIKRIFTAVAKYITPLLAVVIIIMVTMYTSNNVIIIAIDQLLSGRIKLGAYGYVHYGITLLGQNLTDKTVIWDSIWRLSGHTFDCIYSFMIVNQGIIWLFIICVMFYLLAKKESFRINLCIICWALYGVTEVHGLNGYLCFPILLFTLLFSKYDENGELHHISKRKESSINFREK